MVQERTGIINGTILNRIRITKHNKCHKCNLELQLGDEYLTRRAGTQRWYHKKCFEALQH